MNPPNGNGASLEHCAACGAGGLALRMRVAGPPGPKGLVPDTDRYGTALADVVRCAACGHMQLQRFPVEAELSEAYAAAASGDYLAEEAGQRLTARRTLEAIESHARRGMLLEVGCWVGFLLSEAATRGWEVVGIEPSEFAAGFARERLGLDVRTGGVFELPFADTRFDAVVLADVLEHIPAAAAALARIGAVLAPHGVLALALPDAGSLVARAMGRRWWSVIPTHVHYFTRSSLRVLLGRCGFEVVAATTAPKSFSVGYYLGRLGGYSPRLARGLVSAAERAGMADRQWAPDFRDRMLVLARRRRHPQLP